MTLLPASRTRTETAIDETTQRILDVPTPGADLWSPDTCPADLLPWLAWAFSVEVWNAAWPVAVKRSVIRDAVRVHRLKGTRKAVEIALAALGFRIDIVEGWEDGGDPHRFRLDAYGADVFATGFAIDDRLFARISRVIETVKPVRSHFNLRIGEKLRGRGRSAQRRASVPAPAPRSGAAATNPRDGYGSVRAVRSQDDEPPPARPFSCSAGGHAVRRNLYPGRTAAAPREPDDTRFPATGGRGLCRLKERN